jgi:cyclopropane-fatty-acyl-phospholipid synthase
MTAGKVKDVVVELLGKAGVTVNGKNPWDLQVFNEKFYQRIISQTVLGVGESYMDGWWDCEAMDQMLDRMLRIDYALTYKKNWRLVWLALQSKWFNHQKVSNAFKVGETHYDVGNVLYSAMLDKRLVYTSGYWRRAKNLDQAQEHKLELICKKINLKPGMTVLELGCGFGSFAKFAAENYGVKVTGYTVSRQQVKLGRELCRKLPVEIHLEDYRKAKGKYDRVISIGIMEHVGHKNYRTYMELVHKTLKDDGIAFFHTIGSNFSKTSANAWTNKYIFPNGMIPSIKQLGKAMEGLFVMEDWHNFGEDYDKTLMAWFDNFKNAWPELKKDYDDRFYRMWRFYLLSSAASFRARDLQLWQVVMTKIGKSQPNCRIT